MLTDFQNSFTGILN